MTEQSTLMPGVGTDEGFSRLRIPPDTELPHELLALADATYEATALRAGALDTPGLMRFLAWVGPLLDPGQGLLPFAERELIAVVVSAENRCTTCVLTNVQILGEAIGDASRALRLAVNHRHVALSLRERALADFAAKLTREPAAIEDADVDGLRQVGLGDEEIFHAIQLVALFNATNRMHSALGTRPDATWRLDTGPAER